jgi:hypothetical protein
MAKGPLMLQIQAHQYAHEVALPILEALVFDTLDGDSTTVREIAVQKDLAIWVGAGDIHMSEQSLCQLYLVFPQDPILVLHAPSHVPSPPISGAGMAILRIADFGFGDDGFPASAGRIVSAHAYLDETVGVRESSLTRQYAPHARQRGSVELSWQGPGEVTLRFIDRQGQAVLEETYSACGTPGVQLHTARPLRLGARNGQLEVAPIVVSPGASVRSLTLDGQPPEPYVRRRCESIGCSTAVVDDAARGNCMALPRSGSHIAPTFGAVRRLGLPAPLSESGGEKR